MKRSGDPSIFISPHLPLLYVKNPPAKQYGVYIQISDTTYKPVRDLFVVRDLDFVVVKGKTEPAQVYELISEVGKEPDLYKKLLPSFS